MTGARRRGESGMNTEIWSGPRNSIGDMNGRYGRLDSTTSVAPDIARCERGRRGVRVQKVVGVVSEVAVAR